MKTNLKRTILALTFMMIAGANYVYGQCDKTITIKSSQTVMLDEEGKVEKTKEEATTITISKTQISIVPGDEGNTMSGPVDLTYCNWTLPYKTGKSIVKGTLTNGNGNQLHATLTIIGVDGKVTLTFEAEEKGKRKVQVVADKFE
jgi:hypothetical protein